MWQTATRRGSHGGLLILSHRSSAARRLSASVTAVVVLALAIVAPGPVAAAAAPTSNAFAAAPWGDFSMNLYGKGDFVPQYTEYWCIGASMQMMLNIIGVTDDAKRASQGRYMRVARSMGPSLRQVDHGQGNGGTLGGAGSGGWARGLWSSVPAATRSVPWTAMEPPSEQPCMLCARRTGRSG